MVFHLAITLIIAQIMFLQSNPLATLIVNQPPKCFNTIFFHVIFMLPIKYSLIPLAKHRGSFIIYLVFFGFYVAVQCIF